MSIVPGQSPMSGWRRLVERMLDICGPDPRAVEQQLHIARHGLRWTYSGEPWAPRAQRAVPWPSRADWLADVLDCVEPVEIEPPLTVESAPDIDLDVCLLLHS